MPKLSDWKWAIDYSNAVGQKEAQIPPMLFKTRKEARDSNLCCDVCIRGRVAQVVIREISRKEISKKIRRKLY